jgi:hypothetical protein
VRPGPSPGGFLAWASAVLGSEVTVVRSLRLGGSPWLLRTGDQNAVLRVAAAERAGEAETEAAALTYAARAAARPTEDRIGLVHGDLWHGNTLSARWACALCVLPDSWRGRPMHRWQLA